MIEGLKNKQVNNLNIHFGIQRFAEHISSMFGPIYLYILGVELYQIFLLWSLIFIFRFVFRPFVFLLIKKIGIKACVIIGSFLFCGLYPLLSIINDVNYFLILFVAYFALVDVFYWFPYHIWFTLIGDNEKRGRQSGARHGITQILTAISPFIGGYVMETFGFYSTSVISFLFFALAILPLYGVKNVKIPNNTLSVKNALSNVSKRGLLIYGSQGFMRQSSDFSWKLLIFIIIGSTMSFGGLMAIVMLSNILLVYFIGYWIDAGKDKYVKMFGAILVIAGVVGKVFFGFSIYEIMALELLSIFSFSLIDPYVNVVVYNSSKLSRQPIWYQFFSEIGWDLGAILACLLTGSYLYLGGDIRISILLAIIAVPLFIFFISSKYEKIYLTNEIK